MKNYSLTYPSIIDSENRLFYDLDRILSENDVEPRTAFSLKLVLSEAFANALIHGNKMVSSKSIKVRLQLDDNIIAADITDEGEGGLSRVQEWKGASRLADSGRGISLMKHWASGIEFRESTAGGLSVIININRKEKVKSQS